MSKMKEKDYNKNFDIKTWGRIFGYMRPYRKHVIMLVFFMFLVGGADALYPQFNRIVIDRFIIPRETAGVETYIFYYALLVAVQAVSIWAFIALAGKLEMNLSYDIRKAGFKRLQELSFSYYDKTAVGWMMARMTSDITRLGEIVSWGIVDVAWGLTLMVSMLLFMLVMNWKLTLLAMAVTPVLAAVSFFFQKVILKSYRKVRKTNSRITGAFNEGIMGAKTTKVLVLERENLKAFGKLTDRMYGSSVKAAVFSALYLPVVLTLGSIGTSLALFSGGKAVLAGAITYGTLFMFISYTLQFFEPVMSLAAIFAEMQNAQASAERVLGMIHAEPSVKDSAEVKRIFGDVFTEERSGWPVMEGDVEFRHVSFQYENGEKVLDDFNLRVRAGQTVALVGETGSGKSTIVNLACRFYEPTSGEVLIDGVDYRQRSLLWLQSNLGYVLQSPHLFSGTIMENIRYGRLEATDEEVMAAARLVNADGFIAELSDGYASEVGEGGGRLSTGQKQLISFARAVLADPRIFVLDEATSSVDTETEAMIQQAIDTVLRGRTSFVIAHRLSTIRNASLILVIRNGISTESGTHSELLRHKGYYYSLYTNQFMEDKEERILDETGV